MNERHLSVVEAEAAEYTTGLDAPRVSAVAAVLHAHTHRREFAAAVCLNVAPMLEEARQQLLDAQQRVVKLERLAAAAEQVAVGTDDHPAYRIVAGKEIAVVAVQEARAAKRTELHYQEWFALFREAGWVIESKNPQSAFLTSLSRCGLVERVGERSGVYRVKGDSQ